MSDEIGLRDLQPPIQPDASDSAYSGAEVETDEDDHLHDTDERADDVESDDNELHSSPETDHDSSPFFQHPNRSTPNTSPDSISPDLANSLRRPEMYARDQNRSSTQENVDVGDIWASLDSATPLTARPSLIEGSASSYFDSRPKITSKPNDVPQSPRELLRTPTASRPTSSHKRGHTVRPTTEFSHPLLSPRMEAGEMLEREASELRERLQSTRNFQLQGPPLSSKPPGCEQPVINTQTPRSSIDSTSSEISSISTSTSQSVDDPLSPPQYDPGPPGARRPYSQVCPREDEGSEALPNYSCAVHIEGWMPRKAEFVKPGVQANHRMWKRQYIVLHGTSLRSVPALILL